MAVTLNSYEDVKKLLDNWLNDNGITRRGPHGGFWDKMSYDEFTTGTVPNVSDPDTGAPFKILVKGKPDESTIIQALRGAPGTPFDPQNGSIPRMPAFAPPMPDDQIDALADWIKRGCPDTKPQRA